ncbi:MAG: hypothetical protein WCV92_00755 [Candidatus Buchananbacteria bacterium]
MKKITSKKIGAFIISLALLAMVALPVVASAQLVNGSDITGEFTNAAGIQTNQELPNIIGSIVYIILSFLGIVAVLIILLGGFKWMTAQGDDTKVEKAKKLIYSGIIGLVIIFAAVAIAMFVLNNLSNATGSSIKF